MKNNERLTSGDIWSMADFYRLTKRYFHVSSRTVRTYITKGLIPPPERQGRKAFYDIKKSKIWEHLQVINRLQNYHNLSLDDIGAIIDKYRKQIVDLNLIMTSIELNYHRSTRSPSNYIGIRDRFLEKIQKGVPNLKKLDIKDIAKEVTGKDY